MAESPIDRLKRLAREKKEAAAKVVAAPEVPEVLVTQPESANPATGEAGALAAVDAELAKLSKQAEEVSDGRRTVLHQPTVDTPEHTAPGTSIGGGETSEQTVGSELGSGAEQEAGSSSREESNLAQDAQAGTDLANSGPSGSSSHPLAMEFAEMEAALLSKDPNFKMILRQIHRHLATDPDLVTQMSEAEIQSVVSGLVVIANAEVVEPAKAKTVKAAVAKAKKQVISVDDL